VCASIGQTPKDSRELPERRVARRFTGRFAPLAVIRSVSEIEIPPSGPVPSGPLNTAWVDAVAVRVVELMRHGSTPEHGRLMDAATLAAELGVTRSWVYEHRDELGAVRLGTGTKPRLRFDLNTARRALFQRGEKALTSSELARGKRVASRRTVGRRRTTAAGSVLTSRPRETR
jgi:hypothetical protein